MAGKKGVVPSLKDGKTPIRRGRKGTSSTGKRDNVNVAMANWRRQVQIRRVKFDDDQKEIYLTQLAIHGLKGRSAQAAGVSEQTIRNHVEDDPEFAEAYEAATQQYRDMLAAEVTRRGVHGVLKPVYSKGVRALDIMVDDDGAPMYRDKADGRLVKIQEVSMMTDVERDLLLDLAYAPASIREHSDRLLELDIKRVDPSYRDKSTVDLNTSGGGVMLAPAGMSPEEAIADGEAANAEARKKRAQQAKVKS